MSTSAIDRRVLRAAFAYLLISLFCAAAGAIYEVFSHGVWSFWMVYAFLFPLMLGALPFCWIALRGSSMPTRWTLNFHGASVTTLTVGSFFEGVLAIYGTTNRMTILYWIAGGLLMAAALITQLLTHRRKS